MRRMFSKNQITQIADQEVTSLVEGGTLENAKPIYQHTITILGNGSNPSGGTTRLALHIFDNSETAYTKTTILAKLKEIENCLATGLFDDINGSVKVIVSYLTKLTNDKIYALGNNLDDGSRYIQNLETSYSIDDLLGSTAGFNDKVIKMN